MIDRDRATAMHLTFVSAAECPLRQVSGEMGARAREWQEALTFLDEMADSESDWGIDLVGSVTAHMVVAFTLAHGQVGGVKVERVLHRDGGAAIQFTDPFDRDPRPKYRNFHSAASPAVVRL